MAYAVSGSQKENNKYITVNKRGSRRAQPRVLRRRRLARLGGDERWMTPEPDEELKKKEQFV